jgi:hypothetical protein
VELSIPPSPVAAGWSAASRTSLPARDTGEVADDIVLALNERVRLGTRVTLRRALRPAGTLAP